MFVCLSVQNAWRVHWLTYLSDRPSDWLTLIPSQKFSREFNFADCQFYEFRRNKFSQIWISEFTTGNNEFSRISGNFLSSIWPTKVLYSNKGCPIGLFVLLICCTHVWTHVETVHYNSKLPKSVISYDISTRENRQSTLDLVCFLAGDGVVYGCYQIFPGTAKAIRFVAVVKRRGQCNIVFLNSVT